MGVSILFFIAVIIYITGAVFCPNKDNETKDGIHAIVFHIITLINIVAIGAMALDKLHVKINLLTTSIMICIMGVLFYIKIILNKKTSKVNFPVHKVAGVLVVSGVIGYISVRLFNFALEDTYPIQDAAYHFLSSTEIVRNESLGQYPFTAYLNAICIEVLQPLYNGVDIYKSFIISDIFFHLLEGVLVYLIFSQIFTHRAGKIFNPFFSILYFIGYPYLCFSYGFVRQQRGMLLLLYVIYCMILLNQKRQERKSLWLLIILATINIMESYPIYVLQACSIIVVMFGYLYQNEIKVFFRIKWRRWLCFFTLVFATVIMLFFAYKKFSAIRDNLSQAGGTYFSIYSDFIFFLPIIVYTCIEIIRGEKTLHLSAILFTCSFIVTIFEFVLWWNGIMSTYYFYKGYYALWGICWICAVTAVQHIYEQNKQKAVYSYVSLLFVLISFEVSDVSDAIIEKDPNIENQVIHRNYFKLVEENLKHIARKEREVFLSTGETDIYDYVIKEFESDKVCYVSTALDRATYVWYAGITGKNVYEVSPEDGYCEKIQYIATTGEFDYIIISKESALFLDDEEYSEKFAVIYENSAGMILGKKTESW